MCRKHQLDPHPWDLNSVAFSYVINILLTDQVTCCPCIIPQASPSHSLPQNKQTRATQRWKTNQERQEEPRSTKQILQKLQTQTKFLKKNKKKKQKHPGLPLLLQLTRFSHQAKLSLLVPRPVEGDQRDPLLVSRILLGPRANHTQHSKTT